MSGKSLFDNVIAYSPVLGKVFGVCGALLIQQIHFHCSSKNHLREGEYWVYNTTHDWADKFMFWDERTIRSTLKKLRDQQVVVTAVFNKFGFDKTLWYRIDYSALLNHVSQALPMWKFQPDPSGNNFRIVTAKISAPIPKTYPETYKDKSFGFAKANPPSLEVIPETTMLPKNGIKKGPTSSSAVVAEVLLPSAVKKETMVMELYKVWATHVPRHHDEVKFVGEFTMKQKGMVAQLGRSWEGRSSPVLTYVIEHWTKFGKYVNAQNGTKSYPAVPSLEFLVKNKDGAMNFFLAKSEAKDAALGIAVTCTEPTKKFGKIVLKKGPSPDKVTTLSPGLSSPPVPVTVGGLVPMVDDEDEEDKPVTLEFLLQQKFGKL